MGYQDRVAFEEAVTALSARFVHEDFDSLRDGEPLPTGNGSISVQFNYDFSGVGVQVRSVSEPKVLDTTSKPNYVGTDDAGVFQDGDDFSIETRGSSVVYALGLFISTADNLQPGDLVLTANGHSVSLSPRLIHEKLIDGANVYFLGIIDTAGFTLADLTTVGKGYFVYTIDDVVLAVDLPGGVFSDSFEFW